MSINLASKFAKKVDERFSIQSQATAVCNNDYEFTGVETVNVYSIPVVPLTDYNRSASANRYGTATNLTRNKQALTVSQDRAFTFTIDKGDHIQSQMVTDAGRALSREISEIIVPKTESIFGDTHSNVA